MKMQGKVIAYGWKHSAGQLDNGMKYDNLYLYSFAPVETKDNQQGNGFVQYACEQTLKETLRRIDFAGLVTLDVTFEMRSKADNVQMFIVAIQLPK